MNLLNNDLRELIKGVVQEDPLKCNQCDYRATRRQSLKQHVESMHENVKFKCPNCDKAYSNKTHMLNHKKATHQLRKLNVSFVRSLMA